MASNTALSNLRLDAGTVVDVDVLVVLVLVVVEDDVVDGGGAVVEVVVAEIVVGGSTLVASTVGADDEPEVAANVAANVAAVESDPLVADASTTTAMPTTPTIQTRLAMTSILAGTTSRTAAPRTRSGHVMLA